VQNDVAVIIQWYNQSCMKMAFNYVFHNWTKHIDVAHHFILEVTKPSLSKWQTSYQDLASNSVH
jgi:hypothetical protein